MIKLKDIIKNYALGQGIFSIMAGLYDVPWKNDIDSVNVDIDFCTKYGERCVSQLVIEALEKYNGRNLSDNENLVVDNCSMYVVSNQGIYTLAKILYGRYGINWNKLYNTLKIEYNPIHNYNITESESLDNNNDNKVLSNISDTDNSVYGFNSPTPVDTSKVKQSNTSSSNSKLNSQRSLSRVGNIGVTTTQKMLNDERSTWRFDFFEEVFKQTINILTIPYYGSV